MLRIDVLTLAIWCIAVFALFTLDADAQWERPRKKLIEYGWDVPYPDFVRQHIRQMEERPFDGIIFRLRNFNRAFAPVKWDETQLKEQFEDLARIEWRKFTDNFLCIYAATKMDWFNDEHWDAIVHNIKLVAKAARIGRCKGLCFDPEPYGPNPWLYTQAIHRGEKTFEEYWVQVRKRGAQFMRAIMSEMPNVRFMTLFQLSIFRDLADADSKVRMEKLKTHHYGLLPAFLNGMLDAAGADILIIDGNEPAYYYTDAEQYFRAYHMMKQRALAFIAPENRRKYIAQVRAGSALYMDQLFALRQPPRAFLSYFMTPNERARWFEHNVYWALFTSDEYVWCYSERMNWWKNQNIPAGAEEAIISARRKVAKGEPLGFTIRKSIETAMEKQRVHLQKRLIRRTAVIRKLPADVKPPVIDGKLDESVWRYVEPLEPFLPLANSFADKTDAQTTAWVTYDDRALYIAFRCEEPHINKLRIVGEKRDDDIWRGDVVEVLISAGENPTPYYHFIVNPHNIQWDGKSAIEGDDVQWNAVWRSGVAIGRDEWTVEIAIPWSTIGGAPKPNSKRRANLCRQRMPIRELSAWSTMVRGFLEAENFGTWVFVE